MGFTIGLKEKDQSLNITEFINCFFIGNERMKRKVNMLLVESNAFCHTGMYSFLNYNTFDSNNFREFLICINQLIITIIKKMHKEFLKRLNDVFSKKKVNSLVKDYKSQIKILDEFIRKMPFASYYN